jgi:hypothetical protein
MNLKKFKDYFLYKIRTYYTRFHYLYKATNTKKFINIENVTFLLNILLFPQLLQLCRRELKWNKSNLKS